MAAALRTTVARIEAYEKNELLAIYHLFLAGGLPSPSEKVSKSNNRRDSGAQEVEDGVVEVGKSDAARHALSHRPVVLGVRTAVFVTAASSHSMT
jgi:hypothetical protein